MRAVEIRSDAARWLLSERLPDWDLALIVVSEFHSAIEPLWHGVDSSHPLHAIESGAAAGTALRDVYSAIDRLIGDLQVRIPGRNSCGVRDAWNGHERGRCTRNGVATRTSLSLCLWKALYASGRISERHA